MQNRARQFLPFDALKGFREALAKVEKKKYNKIDLLDDSLNELNLKISKLKKGDNVLIKYYYGIEYIETSGVIKKIDNIYKNIYLLNTKISFDDIINIELFAKTR